MRPRMLVVLVIATEILQVEVQPTQAQMGSVVYELGYVPLPWAKSKEPATLTALHKLRPANLPNHALALWVADRLARDLGAAPSHAQTEAALKAFKRQGRFWVRDDDSGLWLSNGSVGLALLPGSQGAGLASLCNLQTGTECIFKQPADSTPWRLLVLRKWPARTPAPVLTIYPFRGSDLSCLKEVDGGALQANWKLETSSNEARLTVRWRPVEVSNGSDEFAVTATITMGERSPLIRWRAEVHRVSGSEYSLITLRFPVLRALTAPGESDLFLSWGGRGRGHLYRGCKGWGNEYLTYPHGGWTLQFVSLSFGPESTLYLACHNGQGYFKQFSFRPGETTYIDHVGWSPDNLEMPYDVVMGPMKGDWYEAARLYREWALKQQWCAKGPLWKRAHEDTVARHLVETDVWDRPNWNDSGAWKTGINEVQANMDWFWEGKASALTAGADEVAPRPVAHPPTLGIWWYVWEKQGFDDDTPSFDARPGVKEEFEREAARGLTVLPYIQTQVWDAEALTFDNAAKAAVVKRMDGKWDLWNLAAPLAQMCSSQRLLQDTTARVADYVHKLGANAVYLDTFPSHCVCYDPNHGHTLGPGGYWAVQDRRRLLERIKREQGQQFGIMMENSTEPLMDCVDAQMSWWFVEPSDAPLWPAIYGGYTVISGVRTDWLDDVVSFRLKVGRAFLWGSQLGRSCFADHLMRIEKAEFMRKLACLKAQTRKFLTYGDMLRPPQWLEPVPRVSTNHWIEDQARHVLSYDALESALWRSPDGDLGLAIVNFDDKLHTASFGVREVFRQGRRQASVVTEKGETNWRLVKAEERLAVEVPAADGMMILFRR